MKISNSLFHFAGFLILLYLSSCSILPDSETTKKLDGKWEMSKTLEEMEGTIHVTEILILDAENEKFETQLTLNVIEPLPMQLAIVSYEGEWYASKKKLVMTIDENSINWIINDLFSKSEKREFIDEMESELLDGGGVEGGAILKISSDSFTLKDEEEGTRYTYHRIQSEANKKIRKFINSNKDNSNENDIVEKYQSEQSNHQYLLDELSEVVCTRMLTSSDLQGLSKDELRILRNTIFARHGRKFKSEELKSYFNNKPWYNGVYDEISISSLSSTEQHNLRLIQSLE